MEPVQPVLHRPGLCGRRAERARLLGVWSAPLTDTLTDNPTAPRVEPRADTLLATTGRRSVVIAISEIEWGREAQDYCVLVHIAKTSYLLRDSIRRLEPRLATHGFVRVHRSALINLARVRELRRPTQRDWYLVLDDGTELPVSRRLRPEIQRRLGRLGEVP